MADQESLLAAIHQAVELVPYTNAWPRMFEAERSRIVALFPGAFVAIEHFGSTTIPQMSAKPIVDILAGVESLSGAGALAAQLCESGYSHQHRRIRETTALVAPRPP